MVKFKIIIQAVILAAFSGSAASYGAPVYIDLGDTAGAITAPETYNQVTAAGTISSLLDTNGVATGVGFTLVRYTDDASGATQCGSIEHANVAKLIPAIDPAAQGDSLYINNAGKGPGVTVGFQMTFSGLTDPTYDITVLPTFSAVDVSWKIATGTGDSDIIVHPAETLSTVAQWTDVAPVGGEITITGYGVSTKTWCGIHATFVALNGDFELAKVLDPACLDHVRVISHANWNNQHSDNPESTETSHSGWTWSEMETEFAGDGVVFDYIANLNNYDSADIGFATTTAGPGGGQLWTPWEFMENYSNHTAEVNAAIQHVFDRIQAVGRPDLSDAGMVYYLFTGDDQGGPAGLKTMIDNGFTNGLSAVLYVSAGADRYVIQPQNSVILNGAVGGAVSNMVWTQVSGPNTAALSGETTEDLSAGGLVAGMYVFQLSVTGNDGTQKSDSVTVRVSEESTLYEDQDGAVIMEAENTVSDYDLWELRTVYQTYTGSGYLDFTGNSPVTGTAKSPLVYDFIINESGLYYLHLHAAKVSQYVDGDWRSDVANDCYVKVEGDYTAHPDAGDNHGDPATYDVLSRDTKFYGGNQMAFGWYPGNSTGAQLDPGGEANKRIAVYNFKAGERYRLTMSGRSRDYAVNRIVFRHVDTPTYSAFNLDRDETIAVSNYPPVAGLSIRNGDFEAQPLGENANARAITGWYEYSLGTEWDDFIYSSTNNLSRDGNVLCMGKATSFVCQSLGTIDDTMAGVQVNGVAIKRNGYYWQPVVIELFAGAFPQAADETDLSGLISLGSYIVNPDGYEALDGWGSKGETGFESEVFSFDGLPAETEIWLRLSVVAEEASHQGCVDDLSLEVQPAASGAWADFIDDYGLSGDKFADQDEDGVTDWAEYILGGNPTNPAVVGLHPSFDVGSGTYSFALVGDPALTACVLTNSSLADGEWGTNAILDVTAADGVMSNYTQSIETIEDALFIKFIVE